LFTALAFPPAGVWVLAVFAPVPLVWAGCRATRWPSRCALLTALGVSPLWVYEQSWLIEVTEVGYPLLVMYMSAYAGVFVWVFALVRRSWLPKGRYAPLLPAFIVAPIVWTALEVIRGQVMLTGYPWYLAGHPLIESPRLAAPASLLGAYFVSFLTVALSGALADAAGWMGVARGMGGIGAAGVAVAWVATGILGRVPASPAEAPSVRVAVVQTNVPQDNKLGWKLEDRVRDWDEFTKLTREAAAGRPRPDLIVWPETMFPGEGLNADYLAAVDSILKERGQDPEKTPATFFVRRLLELQEDIGIPMLVGAEGIEGFRMELNKEGKEAPAFDHRYNSTFLVEAGKIREDRYDKIELTPFGEVIPYVWRWPGLERLIEDVGAGGMKFDLTPGARGHVFTLGLVGSRAAARIEGHGETAQKFVKFVTPICFEGTKPELCRRLVYKEGEPRASLIINVSNDGWFGTTTGWRGVIAGGRQQHLQAARWRCVELGVPMVRAVNTGISAYVDRTGKIRHAGPDGRDSTVSEAGVMTATVPLPDETERTVFGRIGNVFGWTMVVVGVLLPAVGMSAVRQRSNRPTRGS
jgi:apolipoprotein N-acyltransferase